MTLQDLFKPRSSGTGAAVTAGLLSAAAAAGVTYFLFGTEKGARKREKIKKWSKDMKESVAEKSSELTSVTKEIYEDMSTMLKDKADILKNIEKEETSALADRIRNHWEEVREDIEDTIDKVAKDAKETMKS